MGRRERSPSSSISEMDERDRAAQNMASARQDDDQESKSDASGDYAEDGERKGRRWFSVNNVGGSLAVLIPLAVLAWGIREIRKAWDRHRERVRASTSSSSLAPAFATISAPSLRMLVDEGVMMAYAIVDVRPRDTARTLPAPFADTINIPESELATALQLPQAAWNNRYGPARQPNQREPVIFLSPDGAAAMRAATSAGSLGYSRCAVLKGGLEGYAAASSHPPQPIRFISRDALALLHHHHFDTSPAPPGPLPFDHNGPSSHTAVLANGDAGHQGLPDSYPATPASLGTPTPGSQEGEGCAGSGAGGQAARGLVLIDLRRHDEREMYASIQQSKHVPGARRRLEHILRLLDAGLRA